MVGNTQDARIALTRFYAGDRTNVLSVDGTTRIVWLINGVVYKCGDDRANDREHENILNMRHSVLPEHIAFPDISLFEFPLGTVVAMEYVEGQPMARCYCKESGDLCDSFCAPDDVCDLMESMGLDSGGMNIVYRDETYWIIDAG